MHESMRLDLANSGASKGGDAGSANRSGTSPHSLKREYYDALRQLTLELAGIHLGRDHAFLIETRLAGLARSEGFPSLADMVDDLFASGQNRLAVRVVSALLERDVRFFGDLPSLKLFAGVILPALKREQLGRPARILSFGCASGQEVWTLAMIAHQIGKKLGGLDVEITGVDYPSAALERGRLGIYTHFEVQRGLPIKQLIAGFEPHGPDREDWSVKAHLRENVRFEDFHLLSKLDPLGQFDCVVFRGSLARYSGPAQVRVLRGVSHVVDERGFLLLGTGESVAHVNYGFDEVDGLANLMRRRVVKPIVEEEPELPKRTHFGPERP